MWAKKKFDNFFESKSVSTTLERKRFAVGTFLALGRVAHMEGNGCLGWIQAPRG